MSEFDQGFLARTRLVLGDEAIHTLASAHVAVFGLGGVGGHTVEALARSGIGELELIDADVVEITNINRQLVATTSTIGLPKVEIARQRVLDINPACNVIARQCFFLPDTSSEFDFASYDYVVDAVDTLSAKLHIVCCAHECHTPVISSMGAGNKLDPCAFEVCDIYETRIDPLAKEMRKELRKRGIDSLRVVSSQEQTSKATLATAHGRHAPGSVAFVPPVVGMIMASVVVRDLLGIL